MMNLIPTNPHPRRRPDRETSIRQAATALVARAQIRATPPPASLEALIDRAVDAAFDLDYTDREFEARVYFACIRRGMRRDSGITPQEGGGNHEV